MNATPPRRRVLVVEGHDDERELLLVYLANLGFEVTGAKTGTDAIDALRRDKPNVVLLDLVLPDMMGWDFRREQRTLPDPELATIPVIVTSGFGHEREPKPAIDADALLVKPYDLEVLAAIVTRLCVERSA